MKQQPAKSAQELAALFGCTVAQAQASIDYTAADLRSMARKARKSRTGHLRGTPAIVHEEGALAFEKVSSKPNPFKELTCTPEPTT